MTFYPELLPDASITWRVVASTILIFIFIIFLTRLVGKRGVSKMNSFDWIVTVALGSIVAAGVVSPDDFGPALVASFGLVSLQWILTKLSLRTGWIEPLVKANPTLLRRDGKICEAGQDPCDKFRNIRGGTRGRLGGITGCQSDDFGNRWFIFRHPLQCDGARQFRRQQTARYVRI